VKLALSVIVLLQSDVVAWAQVFHYYCCFAIVFEVLAVPDHVEWPFFVAFRAFLAIMKNIHYKALIACYQMTAPLMQYFGLVFAKVALLLTENTTFEIIPASTLLNSTNLPTSQPHKNPKARLLQSQLD